MPSITIEPYTYVGARNAIVYGLNAYSRPAGTGAVAYTGIELKGLKSYGLTVPPARRIAHVGNDGLRSQQLLPPIEPAAAEINIDGSDLDLLALITGTTIIEKAGIRLLPHLSDRRGSEPNLGLITYQAAVADSGAQRWRVTIVSNTKMIPRIPGGGPEPIDIVFDLAPNPVDVYLWGSELAPLSDPSDPYSGVSSSQAFQAGIWDGFCAFRPRIASFLAQAAQVLFPFPDNLQAANVTDVLVVTALTNGTPVEEDAADYTVATTGVTFDTAPVTTYGAGVETHILYQVAD
jgi:hypothetical protein